MPSTDLKKLAEELESMAVELRKQADVVDARADAMERDREDFVRDISRSLEKLREQAGLPAKNIRSSLEQQSSAA